jgi:hypothetical protein
MRHNNFALTVTKNDNSKQFKEDSTFCPQAGINGQGNSIRAWGYPTRFFRHYANVMYIATNGGPQHTWDAASGFNDDASFVVSTGFV